MKKKNIKIYCLCFSLLLMVGVLMFSCNNNNLEQMCKIIDSAASGKVIEPVGKINFDKNEISKIQEETDKLEADTRLFSYLMFDLKSQSGISYNAHEETTSQSTIKGPYCISVLDEDSSRYDDNKEEFDQTIQVSNNDNYEELRNKYSEAPIEKWAELLNINKQSMKASYPRDMTACTMAKLWLKSYDVLNSNKLPSQFVDDFTGTKYSAIYNELGDKYKVQTKSGWENEFDSKGNVVPAYLDGDPKNDETATNDTGIVYAGDHPYILIVFTSISTDPSKLQPLISALDDYHTKIYK